MSDKQLIEGFRRGIAGRVLSAPLAGTSDPPWYSLLAETGIAAFVTEMITADGFYRGSRKTKGMLAIADSAGNLRRQYPSLGVPVFVQLFGHVPEAFAETARFVEECGYDGIDLNYGCPAKKVNRSGNGAAQMRDIPLALELAAATIENTRLPVTAKLRLGIDGERETYLRLAEGLARLGVAALTLHPRTREEQFLGHSDWSAIARLVEAVDCPVIGNGDITSTADALKMFEQTDCHAIMIGRALIRTPWLAGGIVKSLSGGVIPPEIDWQERIRWTRRHGQMLAEYYGERNGMFRVRRFALHYLRGVDGARELRRQLATVASLVELEERLNEAAELV
ncbi:tRNA-dihydrouridine synthase [bacterium]|nr:tRNA-dihydrouridine synthase [bacterium]